MTRKSFYLTAMLALWMGPCMAGEPESDIVQRAETYYNIIQSTCSNISDSISSVSGVAKANAAVNAVGTAASGGALAVGIAKNKVDANIKQLLDELCEIGGCQAESIAQMTDEQLLNAAQKISEISELQQQIVDETARSKKLGNWRTGLMAGGVATNVAGAIMAGVNRDKSELIQQIQACNAAVKVAGDISHEAVRSGVNPMNYPVLNKLSSVTTWCGQLDVDNVEKIEKQMTATMGTNIAGAVIGTAGVAVSASANSDKIRSGDADKEKALNTTANVLGGANVVTGVVGVGLNISMINTAKNMIKQSERCEEVLK